MNEHSQRRRNRIYRSRDDVIFFGVCSGIAKHFDFAPWGVRLLIILGTFFFPPLILIYIVLGLTLKTAPPLRFSSYEDEDFWNTMEESHSAALRKAHRQFEMLEQRLQRLESIVTSPAFELEERYRRL